MNPKFEKQQSPMGYWMVVPLPSQQELSAYYQNKYYQAPESKTYDTTYSDEEILYKRNRPRVAEIVFERHAHDIHHTQRQFLDVGCGEGFFVNHFFERGWNVTGIDYSDFGIESFHPKMLPFFMQGDTYSRLEEFINTQKKFTLISLVNVLEHVLDPIGILNQIKSLMDDGSMLMITVPNDFSPFQDCLMQNEMVKNEYWFGPPDHLSYFTLPTLSNLLRYCGFRVLFSYADFPIELYLANDQSNYVVDRTKGAAAHKARLTVDNFLVEQGIDKYVDFMSSMAAIGMGRNVTVFAEIVRG